GRRLRGRFHDLMGRHGMVRSGSSAGIEDPIGRKKYERQDQDAQKIVLPGAPVIAPEQNLLQRSEDYGHRAGPPRLIVDPTTWPSRISVIRSARRAASGL